MEPLGLRQKKEWRAGLDDRWVRTGCRGLWDAVFLAFRDYREASPVGQAAMIEEKAGVRETWGAGWEEKMCSKLYDGSGNDELVAKLLPRRLMVSQVIPYVQNNLMGGTLAGLEEEVADKCFLLVEYRQEKKGVAPVEGLRDRVRAFLEPAFCLLRSSLADYGQVGAAMGKLGAQLIVVTPQEGVLFDSGGGGDLDVVIVLAHPDGTFDSVGRVSHTKDGHQKISRLFRCDDEVVEMLRR